MELRVSSQKPGLSSSDCTSDPEEKEISEGEDEDDDRNHKHRRRETHSQSVEESSLEQGLTRAYRKRGRPFENGYSHREGGFQSGEIWKPFNVGSEGGISSRFEKRFPNQASFSKAPLELNHRTRGNQTMSGEVGLVRGRGRDPLSWGIRDPRLGLVDIAAPAVGPGHVPSAMFAGRGFSSVTNAQNSSWNAFGLVSGVPNCGLDSLHPLGLQGTMGPVISPPINIGIPRQRCRDFEERGFCLRGDMCPMEHGVNRIVVEDVQGLSQFNLPVAIPGSQFLGTSSGQGPLPVIMPSDVYDPDQPLWTNGNNETTAPVVDLNQSKAGGTVSFPDVDHSDRPNIKLRKGYNDASAAGSQSSVWGRIRESKHNIGTNEKNDSAGPSSNYPDQNAVPPDVPHQGKGDNVDGNVRLPKQTLLKAHNDTLQSIHKQSHKALCTLFVNGVPLKDNKRESLLSHFQKFGEIVDIYIPIHSEKAFVQFSKREEAEAALRAPDAVMGNRFIKLWWANRDNIPANGKNGTNSVSVAPHKTTLNHALSHPFVPDKGKENPHPAVGKDANAYPSAPQPSSYDHPKPVVATISKAPPPQQKKLENLELLKEQLRKKQEMLEQKRNEFRRQLDKLEKHAVGSKDATGSDPATKGPPDDAKAKAEIPPDHPKSKAETSTLPRDICMLTEKAPSAEPAVPFTSISNQTTPMQEPVKPSFRPLAPQGTPFLANRFKLDNRPTTFRIVSPLPAGLANVAALKEHFSAYGDVSSVEVEESKLEGTNVASTPSIASARIAYTTRRSAEKAFMQGKSWQGQKLQFVWLTSNNSGKDCAANSGSLSASTNSQKVEASGTELSESLEKEADAADIDEQNNKDSKSTQNT